MSTKTPKPRVMWAAYYNTPNAHPTLHRSKAEANNWTGVARSVRVAVIPRGQHKALVAKIARKLWPESERGDGRHTVRAVLDCLGVIEKPKRKKQHDTKTATEDGGFRGAALAATKEASK